MLYILRNVEKQSGWALDFENNIYRGLKQLGKEVDFTDAINPDWDEEDYVYVMHYKDFDLPELKETKAKVIGHVNGTSANPYAYNVHKESEMRQLQEVIDVTTFNSFEGMEATIAKYPFIKNPIAIGFPLDLDVLKNRPKVAKKKKIVVSGRISPDKQFYLATFLLKNLLKEYEIVFTVLDKSGEWSNLYDLPRFEEMGFRILRNIDKEAYYRELDDAEFIFICSLGETLSLAIAEGVALGCYPVVPDMKGEFPCWNAFLTGGGYEPFSRASVEEVIRTKPVVLDKVDALLDYKKVCQRLAEGLLL